MGHVLQNKGATTKFQILIEIAASQPSITQKDIAQKLGVSPQAVSEYMETLLKEGQVISQGRSKYKVTPHGTDWILKTLREFQSYINFVKTAVTNITVCAAIADCNLTQGQKVGLRMKEGLLFATNPKNCAATGVAVANAKEGEDVGIAEIRGIVSLKPGNVTILKVPSIHDGGSKNIDFRKAKKHVTRSCLVGAIGIEALIALRSLGVEPGYLYGVSEAAIEASRSGLSSLIFASDDAVPNLLKKLQDAELRYELLDLGMAKPQ